MAMKYITDDLRISGMSEIASPEQVHSEYPTSEVAARCTHDTREVIHQILHGEDDRLLVVIGPCSIHNPDAALEYARRIKTMRRELGADLLIVMRVYFEKPRTTVGWKGLINDPNLDESFEINKGIRLARKLLLDVNEMGVPAGSEFLDLISPQYLADLVSWGAIGARTTESQGHRELASGLSCPVGFKNGTNGGFQIAIDAIGAATHPHVFLSLTKAGKSAIFSTSGNEDCHIILRGGSEPNYDAESVARATADLQGAGLYPYLMVDCSHANSSKQFKRQMDVGRDLAGQIAEGNKHIAGVMIESHLHEGRQNVVAGQTPEFGISITDACLGWEDSEVLLQELAAAVRQRRNK
ncbi:MAG: 3-deoxy-7-phosphoheptulonate synthase [Zetaproteobacteria bacterium CG12_big_fil_rev_8_21_14_0_65_54_13]|nr:MAG: 3-deoxy-7-phosphoheptulonate synthase [Zetaproteobacteria bacterium CG23_combo_of_CG06-09_8_20_14_all_54_7]PIW48676.1 MAG: 3-deoxy-7-phosphoheptulonate synthase [Zetaproteobacteria bacterium CG12_big_fil_rev_8_21_14_0_65_54_13]PIX54611.1 MAG: 3-deoxy-7-phosphoheptulonate synthase [Zetaproteobacteria bacterium CG_4_10_14_3_um_filter_54_28]PJA27714.1 MAG: 3-deoxy-7-phosphoheptulonate synthase [Zetaproteobacteria bacterium CG_4_9_14_3_um_filter_54_145]